MTAFVGLSPPYSTIVADPPWRYDNGFPPSRYPEVGWSATGQKPLPYSAMSVPEIAALPVGELVDSTAGAHLYLWTTSRYLRDAFDILDGWGFRYAQTLVWCKTPQGIAGGGAFTVRTEFVLVGRWGALPSSSRVDRNWWNWKRGAHSAKPAAFLDLVEEVSPGPYVELFARQPRLGWDSWGHGFEGVAA